MSVIGDPSEDSVVIAWEKSMKDVLNVKSQDDIPELNIYQCGTAHMHSLDAAKEIAQSVLERGIGIMSNEALKLDESLIEKEWLE